MLAPSLVAQTVQDFFTTTVPSCSVVVLVPYFRSSIRASSHCRASSRSFEFIFTSRGRYSIFVFSVTCVRIREYIFQQSCEDRAFEVINHEITSVGEKTLVPIKFILKYKPRNAIIIITTG